jgi:hypothetical protein
VALVWTVSGWMVLVELAALVLFFGALLTAFGEIRRSDVRRLLTAVLGSEQSA